MYIRMFLCVYYIYATFTITYADCKNERRTARTDDYYSTFCCILKQCDFFLTSSVFSRQCSHNFLDNNMSSGKDTRINKDNIYVDYNYMKRRQFPLFEELTPDKT